MQQDDTALMEPLPSCGTPLASRFSGDISKQASTDLREGPMTRLLRHTAHTLTLVALTLGASIAAPAPEVGAQQVPVVEPPLSRLYGSDALDFGGLSHG